MSGPIVRSGPSTKFSDNWQQAFESRGAAASKKSTAKKAAPKKAAKASKKAKKKS